MSEFDTILSLGYHCNVVYLQKHLNIKKETTLFDWFQSDELTYITDVLEKLNWHDPDTTLIKKSIKYPNDIELCHEEVSSSHYTVEEFKPIFLRRAFRFLNTLKNNKVLFVRINISTAKTTLEEIERFRNVISRICDDSNITKNMKFMLISTVLNKDEFVPIKHEWVIHHCILRSDIEDPIMIKDVTIQKQFKVFLENANFKKS